MSQSIIFAIVIVLLLLVIGWFVYDKYYQSASAAATNTATNQLTDLNNAVKDGDTQTATSIYQDIVRTNNAIDVSGSDVDTTAAKATTLQAVAAAQTILQQSNVAVPAAPVNATMPASEPSQIMPLNSYTTSTPQPKTDVVVASNTVVTTTQPLPVSDIQQPVYTSNTTAPVSVIAAEDVKPLSSPLAPLLSIQMDPNTALQLQTYTAPVAVTSVSNTTTTTASSSQTPSTMVSIAPNTYIIKHVKSGLAMRWRNTDTSKGTIVEYKSVDKKDRNQYFNISNNKITLPDGRCFGINTANGNIAQMINCSTSTVDTLVTPVAGGNTITRAGCIAAGAKDPVQSPSIGDNVQWRCGSKISSVDWLYIFVPVA